MPQQDVTIVAHDIGPGGGGMEVSLRKLAAAVLDSGARLTVVARRCELPPHPNLDVHRVRTPRRPFPIAYPLFAIAAAWTVRRHQTGVLHCTGAIVPLRVDCITVQFCHAAYSAQGLGSRAAAPGRLYELSDRVGRVMKVLGERWCYRASRVRSVIALSPGVSHEIESYFPALTDRLQVIPHGVDSTRFRPDPIARKAIREAHGLSEDDLVAVFVGGDWPRKGLLPALEAVARTQRWKLLVVGRGHRDTYQRRAHELGAGERLVFAGETEDVPAHMAAADVFLFPTDYETFCLVAFEAAAVGLPLLVTRVSGPDMLVEPGVNGEFIDRDVERTSRLLDAYADPVRRSSHGQAARLRAGPFTWEHATSAYLDLFGGLAAQRFAANGSASTRQVGST